MLYILHKSNAKSFSNHFPSVIGIHLYISIIKFDETHAGTHVGNTTSSFAPVINSFEIRLSLNYTEFDIAANDAVSDYHYHMCWLATWTIIFQNYHL